MYQYSGQVRCPARCGWRRRAFVGGFGRSLSIWTPEPYLDFNLIKEGENVYHFKCLMNDQR